MIKEQMQYILIEQLLLLIGIVLGARVTSLCL